MDEKRPEEDKIRENLAKSGYPLEITASRIMQRAGWGIVHNPSFLDAEEGKNREYDVRAYKEWLADRDGYQFTVGVYLVVECKKSDSPWVFVTTEEAHQGDSIGKLIRQACRTKGILWSSLRERRPALRAMDLRAMHHYFTVKKHARTYTEPLRTKDGEHETRIFSAAMSCIKAAVFGEQEFSTDSWLRIFYPVIVFSGHMYTADIQDDKSIDLERVPYVQLQQSYSSAALMARESSTSFIIDVVHEDYLPEFLRTVEGETAAMTDEIGTQLREGRLVIGQQGA